MRSRSFRLGRGAGLTTLALVQAALMATAGDTDGRSARPDIRANVAAVRADMAESCRRARRDPASVRLIAVTKSQGPEVLAALAAEGVHDFGENRVDHLEQMLAAAPADSAFHAIGRIQGRQLREVVAGCACLHSLCDASHLAKLSQLCVDARRTLPVFVQVNTSGEAAKAGLEPTALEAFLDGARGKPGVEIVGLMTMAPELSSSAASSTASSAPSPSAVRACFARLRELAAVHRLPRLSMGMSQDFGIAIEEGATDIRVGTRLFA